ncbi:MAG: hypothetical protein ACFFF9_15930 [Candidatus Thorarchaeota archaeon]
MQAGRLRGVLILFIIIILPSVPISPSLSALNNSNIIAQGQEGPSIYIRYNGLCADGSIYWPRNVTYDMAIDVSDSDNVTTVFADISDQATDATYRVYAQLSEGTINNGTWRFSIGKFLSWEGGTFDIHFTVWACDGLNNWNSALGYRSIGMGPSILPGIFLIVSVIFLFYAVNSTRQRLTRFKEFHKRSSQAPIIE